MKRYRDDMEAVRDAVLETPGDADLNMRRRVFEGLPATDGKDVPLEAYLRKIEANAYRITDEDVTALLAGHSEDAIFECTLAAALREAWIRFETVEDALA